jgi:hypothetical protein
LPLVLGKFKILLWKPILSCWNKVVSRFQKETDTLRMLYPFQVPNTQRNLVCNWRKLDSAVISVRMWTPVSPTALPLLVCGLGRQWWMEPLGG